MEAIVALLLTLVPLAPGRAVGGGARGPRADHRTEQPAVPYPGGFFGQDETPVVSTENFRFCVRPCRPDSVGYLRSPAGPVPASDNPRAVVYMQPGAQFIWTYHDSGCDLVRCAGHDIRIEDGTAEGHPVGQVTAETGHDRLGWTIPADARPESIIRYFCARHASLGMTGAFQVLPVGVLSVSPPSPPQPPPWS
jgi:hypothetical protein